MDNILEQGKTLLLIVVLVVAPLLGALATVSYLYLETKFESVNARIEGMDAKIEGMDARFEGMDKYLEARFDRVDEKFDSVNARIDKHETILNNIRDRVASIEGKMESNSPETPASAAHSPVTGSTL